MKTWISRVGWMGGTPLRLLLVGVLHLYRVTLGPLFAGRCRFFPSCSAYALEAVRVHGALRGSALAAWRVLRCSPLSAGGIDPVPGTGASARPGKDVRRGHTG
jgi:putative membrane protein insertion efficiency factor